MNIDPRAYVAPEATIGENCYIGPFCYVGPHVTMGMENKLQSHVVLDGHTTLGDECNLYPFACIGKQAEDLKYTGEVSYVHIGSRNEIREHVTIHAATKAGASTEVGNDCMIQAHCHIAHECILGDHIIMIGGAKMAGHVTIESHATIGAMSGIQQFVRIGQMAMVGAYSKQTKDLVPFCISDGSPARVRSVNRIGMQRKGKSIETIQIVQQAFKRLIRSKMTTKEAVRTIKEEVQAIDEVEYFLTFIEQSSRGISH